MIEWEAKLKALWEKHELHLAFGCQMGETVAYESFKDSIRDLLIETNQQYYYCVEKAPAQVQYFIDHNIEILRGDADGKEETRF